MVYWAFAAMSLCYLLMTPVRVGAVYASEREKPFRLGVMIWAVRLDIPTSRPRPRKRPSASLPKDALFQAARVLLKGVSVERLALDVTLRLDDAAKNALVCGLLRTGVCCLQTACPRLPLRARVAADFTNAATRIRAGGILSVRVGHIIRAGGSLLLHLIAGRLNSWTNTRLKAS